MKEGDRKMYLYSGQEKPCNFLNFDSYVSKDDQEPPDTGGRITAWLRKAKIKRKLTFKEGDIIQEAEDSTKTVTN